MPKGLRKPGAGYAGRLLMGQGTRLLRILSVMFGVLAFCALGIVPTCVLIYSSSTGSKHWEDLQTSWILDGLAFGGMALAGLHVICYRVLRWYRRAAAKEEFQELRKHKGAPAKEERTQ